MDKFFKNIGRAISKAFTVAEGAEAMSWSDLSGGLNDTGLSTNSSDANLLANNKNWVYACVDKIAITISGIVFQLREYQTEGDDTVIEDNTVLDVLRKPNNITLGHELLYMTVAHLELTGNAYWLLDEALNPKRIQIIMPNQITAALSNDKLSLIGYNITSINGSTYVPADRIIHFKYPSVTNPMKGKGTLSHIAEWVDVDNAATEFNRVFFKNGTTVSGVVETDAQDETAVKLAKMAWEMRHQGVSNAHKVAILTKGSKYNNTGTTPRDMEFSEMDNRFRDKILSGFGVPKSVLGITDIGVSRADAEAKNYVFLAFTIEPKVKHFCKYLDEFFLPKFKGTEKLYFDYEEFIPDNSDLELRENQVGLAGQSYLTINEVRAKEGLPPIVNGDSVYGSFATVPIGKAEAPADAKEVNRIVSKKFVPSRIKKVEKEEKAKDNMADKIIEIMKQTVDVDELAHKQFITRVTPFENKFIAQVKKFDNQLENIVIDELAKEKDFTGNVKALFEVETVSELLIGLTIPVLQELLKAEGQAQLERLNSTEPFNPNNDYIQDKIKRALRLSAQKYTSTTLDLLNSSLGEGLAEGEGIAKLTNRVRDVFALTDTYRAERIARTSVFQAANSSAREAYRQSGVVKEVRWHTAEDEVVCEYCGPLNGKTVDIEDTFFDEGDTVRGRDGGILKLDFDDVEDPPLHANCRCFTNAVVVEARDAGKIETKEELGKGDAEEKLLQELVDEFSHE